MSPKTCQCTGTIRPGPPTELARDELRMNLPDPARLISFLTARLREELGEIWGRPGMAAQLGVLDDLLRSLAAGRLPVRAELGMLFLAYGQHPDFDGRWHAYLH